MPSSFYRFEVWGFDYRGFQFRAHWFKPLARPAIHKDKWCWFLFLGPFEVSGHRGRIWG